jgi:hypothetical protein
MDSPWPVDAAAPRPFAAHRRARSGHDSRERPAPKEKPEQDGRTPDDRDGNEELERQEGEEKPASRRTSTDRGEAPASARTRWDDFETEDTSEWVATERFTLEDELEDTWPNVPTRYFDD